MSTPSTSTIVQYQKENEVVKNNSFIRCSNNLTPIQRKSFALLLKESIEVIRESGEKRYYTMPFVEYKRIMGHPEKMPTKYIRKELKELMTKIIEWDLDEQGYGTSSVMLAGFELEQGSGVLKWAFSPFLIDKLLADGYTPLKLSIVLNFDSKYALALYENIQMRKNFKKTTFGLQEFRALMGVEDGEHSRMERFKNWVLHPSIEEINKKSDLKITYTDLKQGSKITGFEFKWENLTPKKVEQRNQRSHQIEGYRKTLSEHFGEKYKIAGKWYTLTKDGFVNRGKILGGFDIVESYDQYTALDKQGFVTEKNVIAKAKAKKQTLFL